MEPKQLREMADRCAAEAVEQAAYAIALGINFESALASAEMSNRLFIMANNLRERAMDLEARALRDAASEADIPF